MHACTCMYHGKGGREAGSLPVASLGPLPLGDDDTWTDTAALGATLVTRQTSCTLPSGVL